MHAFEFTAEDFFKMSRTLQHLIITLLGLLVILMPSYGLLMDAISFHDERRLILILILWIVFIWAALPGSWRNAPSFKSTYVACFLGVLICGGISACLAISPKDAWLELTTFAGLSFVALFIANLYQQYKGLFFTWLIYGTIATMVLFMTTFYAGYLASFVSGEAMNWPVPITTFDNPRSFNQYQMWTMGIMILPLLALDIKNTLIKILVFLSIACWWVIAYYSASRGAIVSWVTAILLMLILYQKIAWPFVRLQIIAHGFGLLLYALLFKLVPYMAGNEVNSMTILRNTTSDRIELWIKSFQLMADSPWFGVGPMHFAWHSRYLSHPHNSLLQIACEWGMIATALLILISFKAFMAWSTLLKRQHAIEPQSLPTHVMIALTFTLVINTIYSMFDGVIVMPLSQIMLALTVGSTIGVYFSHQTRPTSKLSYILVYRMPLLLLPIMIWAVTPEIYKGLIKLPGEFSSGFPAYGPRYWDENVIKGS